MNTSGNSTEALIQKWDAAKAASDYIECMVISVNAFEEMRSQNNSDKLDTMLRLVKVSAAQLCSGHATKQQESKTICSFCCKDAKKKRAVRGADVLICEDCVELASSLMNNMEQGGKSRLKES